MVKDGLAILPMWEGGGEGLAPTDTTLNMTVCGCCPLKGTSLDSNCHISMARLYTSQAGVGVFPLRNSGAWYPGVPTRLWSTASEVLQVETEQPKSPNLQTP